MRKPRASEAAWAGLVAGMIANIDWLTLLEMALPIVLKILMMFLV